MAVEVSPYLLRRLRSLTEVLLGDEDGAAGTSHAAAAPGDPQDHSHSNGIADASAPPQRSADAA